MEIMVQRNYIPFKKAFILTDILLKAFKEL